MVKNERGNIILLSLVITAVITIAGIMTMTSLSKKIDKKSVYIEHSGGRGRIEAEIKKISRFHEDWLNSNRTQSFSRTDFNNCLPAASDTAPQNFSGCISNTRVSSVADLNLAYNNADDKNKLTYIDSNSLIHAVHLVDISDRPLSGVSGAPVKFDLDGAPCTSNCTYEVISYMMKQRQPASASDPQDPGDVIFAFKISDVKKSGLGFTSKDYWMFVPMLAGYWNSMALLDSSAQNACPLGTYSVKVATGRKVLCRSRELECAEGEMLVGISEGGEALCRNLPTFPAPLADYSKLDCDSWGYRYHNCAPQIPDPYMSIISLTMAYKRSRSGCNFGSSFGFNSNPDSVWVDRGCRATFNVETACITDYYLNTASNRCQMVPVGHYSPHQNNGDFACDNKPANSTYTGRGNGSNSCPWACDPGFDLTGSSCVAPPPTPAATPSPTP